MKTYTNESILIVDDIPTNIKVLFEILNQAGFKVAVAKSGKSALKKAEETLPNLILLDVMMPEMDGFETCRLLKENSQTRNIPVIFMTARSDLIDKVQGLKIGAVDYITKPIEYEEVLARINVHLELRRTQLQLVQEEKMSALGQLISGVAHEINNPINFIVGNIIYAQSYVDNLLALLNLYEKHQQQKLPDIQAYADQIELDFLKSDLPQLLSSMKTGAERVEKIVRSLRSFSRLDDTEYQLFNIHEGIDSTLVLLSNRIKTVSKKVEINIVKNYGEVPAVECYAGPINQVLMNLLANAIDAVEESLLSGKISEKPTIEIITDVTEDKQSVLIIIADNGVGIPEEIQQKIFEQFFTTKPLGKGTGFGLAIAHEIIVDKHKGKLEVQSACGEGARFLITIPIEQTLSNVQ
ncbi:hybrid sensor histidine kinase/response regulator [Nostoc sp. CMAA1605]|uniref:hybrid sensor histidine kinase/response regulator n=1 Tax=Nostoc sp. CMAA1605 TaxID=2055159 RepID=UPI001F291CC4|nr:response regulator [Nostoc sp. CMAA1605]MCF4969269.1 hybrid sensor histidine kinase/response regulator [Nostoc sp. CMAA1605]